MEGDGSAADSRTRRPADTRTPNTAGRHSAPPPDSDATPTRSVPVSESRSARHTADLRGSDYRYREPRTEFRPPDPRLEEPVPVPTNIYRARRPAVAVLLVVPAVAVGLLLIRALALSAFGGTFLIGGVIASSLSLASLPLLVAGLYGLVTGAAHGAEQYGFRVWARPPLAYLIVGIAFAVAAGLAIP